MSFHSNVDIFIFIKIFVHMSEKMTEEKTPGAHSSIETREKNLTKTVSISVIGSLENTSLQHPSEYLNRDKGA